VHNTSIDGSGLAGVTADFGKVTIADSYVQHDGGSGIPVGGAVVTLFGDHLMFNEVGITVSSGSVTFANCLITQNSSPYAQSGAGTLTGSSPGTSLVIGSETGTLSVSPIALD